MVAVQNMGLVRLLMQLTSDLALDTMVGDEAARRERRKKGQ